jgi:NodT family efflux transporter outer membrane factor (OMF) lipoprotein
MSMKQTGLLTPERRTGWGAPAAALALAGLAGLAALTTGCLVGPSYSRPAVSAPGAFREPPPADWKMAQPREAADRGKWWEVFGDPLLNQLEEEVAVSNQSIAQAEAQYRAARAAAWGTRAALFPTVTVGPSASRATGVTSRVVTTAPGASAGGSATAPAPATTIVPAGTTTTLFELPLDVSYEVDVWGRVRRMIESSVATAQASAGDLETLRLSMQAELAVDYYTLRGTDGDKQLLDTTGNAYQKALELTTNRYNQGIASGVDVAQAQTQLETTRAQSIDLEVQRTQLEHAIAVLVGKPPAELTIPRSPINVPPPQMPVALPSELLERRPDIAADERRMAAANAQIGVQQAAYYPNISLSGAGGYENNALSGLFSLPSRFWSIGASAVETLFNGGAISAAVAQARANYDAAVAAYRQQVLTAFQDVEDNLAAMRVLEAEARQQAIAVAAAEKSLALSNYRYQGGITTYLEVITAQATALADERTAVDIQTRRMTAAVNLIKALGGGWSATDLPGGGAVLSRAAGPAQTAMPGSGNPAPVQPAGTGNNGAGQAPAPSSGAQPPAQSHTNSTGRAPAPAAGSGAGSSAEGAAVSPPSRASEM